VGVQDARLRRLAPGTFHLAGELDISNVDDVRTQLEEELGRGHQLVLDTSEVSFMDSQGLHVLIRLGELAAGSGSTIQVLNSSPAVRRLLNVAVPQGIPGVEIVEGDRN
jgi:anti-sigma B factor antagonist